MPPAEDGYMAWLLVGGRGSGKTDASAAYVTKHIHGPPCLESLPGGHRIAIIAPTLADAVESCVNGPSGLRAHDPAARLTGGSGGAMVRWPSGAEAKLFGAHSPDDVERLRAGGNRCLVWVEELAAWRQLDDAWWNMRLGLRLGPWPHVIGSTTPKPRLLIRQLMENPDVRVTRARTNDNPHLDERVRRDLQAAYGGTRIGRQELEGELLEDVEGALWQSDWIERSRVDSIPLGLTKIVVAVDPAVTNSEESDETGIVAVGRSKPRHCPVCGPVEVPHAFVLADRTCKESPDAWARRAVALYEEVKADRLIAETNQGGDLVEATIRNVAKGISYGKIHAKRGKALRAQPVAAIYEQNRVHHCGTFDQLEDQMRTWAPDSGMDSPDRLDALVYAITALGMTFSGPVTTNAPAARARSLPKVPLVKPGGQPTRGGATPFGRVGWSRPR